MYEREHPQITINVGTLNIGDVYYTTIDPQKGDIFKVVVIGYKLRVATCEYDEVTGEMDFICESILLDENGEEYERRELLFISTSKNEVIEYINEINLDNDE